VLKFNIGIIEAVAPFAAAVKPQIAFYECLGPAGLTAFAETCRIASEAGLVVIADVKRGDIGSTATAYAEAYLGGPFKADAVTLSPYLGGDTLEPFLARCADGYGAFVLVRTSNPGASQLQDLVTPNGRLCDVVGDMVRDLGVTRIGERGWSAVGAVVGATWPGELAELRKRLPGVPFLVPGYGAQGGTGRDVLPAFDASGLGAVVNSSRGILYAWKGRGVADWRGAAATAAQEMRDEFRSLLGGRFSGA
jgi:orotidine-5'-phosphate decarboxylase